MAFSPNSFGLFVEIQNEEAAQAGAGSERESEIGPSFYAQTNMSHQLSSLSISAVEKV